MAPTSSTATPALNASTRAPADADCSSFGYPQLTEEAIIDADPDLVFLADIIGYGMTAEAGTAETIRCEGGRTLITTMHDLTLAGQYADRLVLLDQGEIVAEGSATDVLTEDNIKRYYGADVSIHLDDGAITVMPRRCTTSFPTPDPSPTSPIEGAPTHDQR